MGGSGKSTLADKVYNVDAVKNHFEARAWINVSQVYDLKVLLQDLAKEFMGLKSEVSGKMTVEELKEKLREFLNGKKYLANCQIDPVSPHKLKPLSDDDNWDLFTKKVIIAHDNTPSSKKCSFPMQLEELGRKMVEKCRGLPLAIVLLGGLLIGKLEDYKTWSILLDRIYWQLSQDLTPCPQILALNYNDLPSYLKPCFLYLGIYLEDYEISARRLIKMWIAEGFIVQRGNEIVEDIGEEYLEELASRCMIQITQRRLSKYIKKFRIHDVLRDLSISKAKEAGFLQIESNTTTSEPFTQSLTRVRRVVLNNKLGNIYVNPSYQHIRSFFHYEVMNPKKVDTLFRNSDAFGMLRVLDLSYLSYFKPNEGLRPILPKSLGKLVHLRYLRLSYVDVSNLPAIIRNLRNLQILDLKSISNNNDHIKTDFLSNLHQLRHLRLNGFAFNPPSDASGNLQTLNNLGIIESSRVKDGWDKYTNLKTVGFACFTLWSSTIRGDIISTLGKLPNLVFLLLSECSLHAKEMIFSRGGFPKLQDLRLSELNNLEEMKMLPNGLHYVTTLEKLYLRDMPKEFNSRVEKGGEDWEKVAHILTVV
ncbi:hypothetical protein GIB67_006229, partial [Kingdonia uniflora]